MSRKPKGRQLEDRVVKLFERMGWRARRQPGSGRFFGMSHDNVVEHPNRGPAIIECKKRNGGLVTFDKWLGQADMLVIERDYERDPLIIMRFSRWAHFARHDE